MEYIAKFDALVSANTHFLTHPLALWAITAIFIVTLNNTITKLQPGVTNLVFCDATKVIVLFLSLFSVTRKASLALVLTSVIIVAGKFLSMKESFVADTEVAPGCEDVSKSDLLALFGGDENKLQNALYEAGVPLNLSVSDDNAPKIATYLMNRGLVPSKTCISPQ